MPQASLAFDTTSKNPLYTWVGFSEGWPGEEGMVNVLESIRVMAEWIMPICAVCPSIQIDSGLKVFCNYHMGSYLERAYGLTNSTSCSSCFVTKTKTHVFITGVFKNLLLLKSSC